MSLEIGRYPKNKDCAFCITLDDLHPESQKDLEGLDFGTTVEKGPLKILSALFKKFPDIKVTLFTVPNWIDRSDIPSGIFFPLRKLYRKRRSYPINTFNISLPKYAEWVSTLNSFYPNNVEIAIHGLNHHNSKKQYARSQEFKGLNRMEITQTISAVCDIFSCSGLKYYPGFRPPGWGKNVELIDVLQEKGFRYMASDSYLHGPISDHTEFIYPQFISSDFVNFTANCYPHDVQRAVDIAKRDGILVLHAHVVQTEFGLVSLDKHFVSNVDRILKEVHFQSGKVPWFCTLGELAEFEIARNSLKVSETENNYVLTNESNYDLKGLSISVDGQRSVIELIPAKSVFNVSKQVHSSQPLVSVVVTVYNGETNIKNCIDSLINQTYENKEIIVVDDGSSDKTPAILTNYSSVYPTLVKVITQPNNGRSSAKNTGLQASSGEFITFCEDDAVYSSHYLEFALENFSLSSTLGVIGPHYVLNKFRSIMTRVKDVERRRNFYHYNPKSCWFYRKKDLEFIGGFNPKLEFGEDIEPCLKLKEKFPEKKFVYESRSVWLHTEPSSLQKVLRRKYKGGLGMASLKKLGILKSIFPKEFTLVLLVGSLFSLSALWVLVLIGSFYNILVLFFSAVVFFLTVRYKDIKKAMIVSNERFTFVLFGILVEYLWWFATFTGILKGSLMDEKTIVRLLIKRV